MTKLNFTASDLLRQGRLNRLPHCSALEGRERKHEHRGGMPGGPDMAAVRKITEVRPLHRRDSGFPQRGFYQHSNRSKLRVVEDEDRVAWLKIDRLRGLHRQSSALGFVQNIPDQQIAPRLFNQPVAGQG